MDIKKRMGVYIGIFLVTLSFLTYLSRESDNFIAITTDRESKDIFNKNNEDIYLYKKDGTQLKKVKMIQYLSDFINTGSEAGEYIIEVKENNAVTQRYEIEKTKEESLKYHLNYILKSDFIKNNTFLNTLTGIFLIYNLGLLYSFKKDILRKKELIFPTVLLCLKILLTNSEVFSNIFLIRANFVITSILGLYLLLYVENKIDKSRSSVIIRIVLWSLFLMYYIGEVVMLSVILNRKILNYLATNYVYILKISMFFYIWIDALIITLLMFFLGSIKTKKKEIIKQIEKKNLAMIGSFIVLSSVVEIFVNNNKYFYYLNMFEFVYIFWYIFLTDVNTIGKIKIVNLKIFQIFLHTYLFFVITESIWIAIGVIFSFSILNIYTYFIVGTLRVNENYIENLVNRMYLTKNFREFKEQLSKELKKNLELKEVKVDIFIQRDGYKEILLDRLYDDDEIIIEKNDMINGKYDYAVRLKGNKNSFVGLILLQNNGLKLAYEEKRYLEEIAEKLSLVAIKYRFEKLQEELNWRG